MIAAPGKISRKTPALAATTYLAMAIDETTSNNRQSADSTPIDWAAALAEHDRWLRTVAFSRLGDRDAVDEVMQEVALAAVRQAAPLLDRSKIAPWLYRLVVRHVLLFRRKMGRRRKLMSQFEQHRFTDPGPVILDPLGWLLADERRVLIRQTLDELPPRDAEVLLLKYTQDWSYRQMARHLGISQSAVEARLHRARRRMRERLAARNVIEMKT